MAKVQLRQQLTADKDCKIKNDTAVQGRTREQLAAASVEADNFRSQLEVSHAKLQRLERSNTHLRKQRAQMMADLQVTTVACSR